MSIAGKIASNTLWQIIGKIIGTLASGLALILLTRALSQDQFGYYGTALSLTQFAAVICDLGLYVVCLKEISAHPESEEKIFNSFFGLRLVSAAVILFSSVLIIYFLPYPLVVKQTSLLFAFGFLFASIVQLLTTLFQKRMTMNVVAATEAVGRVAMLVVIYLLLKTNINLPWLAAASVISSGIGMIWLFVVASKQLKISATFDWLVWKNIFKQTWPVTLGILLNLVYFRADSIIMSLTRPASDVAIYTAPYKLLEIIATFPHMFMGLIMPLTSAAWATRDYQRLNRLTQRTSEFFLIITVPLLAASLVCGNKIMSLVAGDNYTISGTILFPLMLATAAIFAGTAFTYLAVTIEKQKAMLPFYGLAAIGAIALYLWLIPTYTYVAAAWITAGVELFITLSALAITKKTAVLKFKLWPLINILLSGLLMAVILIITDRLNVILQLMIAGLIYVAVLFAVKALTLKDFQAIIKLKANNN